MRKFKRFDDAATALIFSLLYEMYGKPKVQFEPIGMLHVVAAQMQLDLYEAKRRSPSSLRSAQQRSRRQP